MASSPKALLSRAIVRRPGQCARGRHVRLSPSKARQGPLSLSLSLSVCLSLSRARSLSLSLFSFCDNANIYIYMHIRQCAIYIHMHIRQCARDQHVKLSLTVAKPQIKRGWIALPGAAPAQQRHRSSQTFRCPPPHLRKRSGAVPNGTAIASLAFSWRRQHMPSFSSSSSFSSTCVSSRRRGSGNSVAQCWASAVRLACDGKSRAECDATRHA